MIQEMVNGSIAVLTKPSTQTFEQVERNNLQWALIYAAAASVITGIMSAITAPMQLAAARAQMEAAGATPEMIEAMASSSSPIGSIFGAIIGTIIGSLIGWGVVYGLGRAFGGTGAFGELAWGLSLFSSPIAAATAILNIIPFVGGLVGFALGIYGLYLTYLAIQSGMNLPSQKALYVMLIIAAIYIVFACTIGAGAAAIGLMMAGANS